MAARWLRGTVRKVLAAAPEISDPERRPPPGRNSWQGSAPTSSHVATKAAAGIQSYRYGAAPISVARRSRGGRRGAVKLRRAALHWNTTSAPAVAAIAMTSSNRLLCRIDRCQGGYGGGFFQTRRQYSSCSTPGAKKEVIVSRQTSRDRWGLPRAGIIRRCRGRSWSKSAPPAAPTSGRFQQAIGPRHGVLK